MGIPRSVAPVRRDTWYGILSAPYPDVERVDTSIVTNKFETSSTKSQCHQHDALQQRRSFPAQRVPGAERQRTVAAEPERKLDHQSSAGRSHQYVGGQRHRFPGQGQPRHVPAYDRRRFRDQSRTRDFLRNQFTTNTTNFLNPDPWRAWRRSARADGQSAHLR